MQTKTGKAELERLRAAFVEGVSFDVMQRRFGKTRRLIRQECADLKRPSTAKGKRLAPSLGRFA